MSAPSLIDDHDPAVQYSPDWISEESQPFEVNGTCHGAAVAGLTATLSFMGELKYMLFPYLENKWSSAVGTGVQVVGILGPSVTNGQPTTEYAVDGQFVATYEAPFTDEAVYNVTFFSKRDLTLGEHTLLITNLNGTSPTLFWLDYFLVDQASSSSSPPSTISSTSKTSWTLSHSPSSSSSTHSFKPTLSSTPQSSHNVSSRSTSATLQATNSSSSNAIIVTTSANSPPAQEPTTATLTVSLPGTTTTASRTGAAATTATHHAHPFNIVALVGGILGGALALTVLLLVALWCRRRHRLREGTFHTDPTRCI